MIAQRTRQLLVILLISAALMSCDNAHDCRCTEVDLKTYVVVTDVQGNNLLDPATPSYFKADDIRIYHVQNGVREEVYDARLDWPRMFTTEQNTETGEYAMILFPDDGGDETTTVIQWSDSAADTLVCTVRHWNGGSSSITKILVNNELAYDQATGGSLSGNTWGNMQVGRIVRIQR